VCGDPGPEAVLVLHKLRRGGALVRPVDATGARCLLGVGGVLVLGGKIVWVDDCPLQRRLQLEQPLADQRVGAESGGPSLDELTRRAAGFQPLRPSSRSRWLGSRGSAGFIASLLGTTRLRVNVNGPLYYVGQ
jgi:hypothetical protein